jgi:hypothetical protein
VRETAGAATGCRGCERAESTNDEDEVGFDVEHHGWCRCERAGAAGLDAERYTLSTLACPSLTRGRS